MRFSVTESAIQIQAARAGSPVTASPGSAISPLATSCAAMAARGCGLAFTAAFQPAWSSALTRAQKTWRISMGLDELSIIETGAAQAASRPERVVGNYSGKLPAES